MWNELFGGFVSDQQVYIRDKSRQLDDGIGMSVPVMFPEQFGRTFFKALTEPQT